MIDPKQIARRLWNAVYDPRRSQNGVQIVLRNPRTSTTVFQSGKVICLGAKSEASALIACRKVARLIQRVPNYNTISFSGFKVNNVTASGALGFRVDLNALARHPAHEPYAHYDPDHFPGLHYKLPFSLFDEEFRQKQIQVKAEASAALSSQKSNGITGTIDLTSNSSPYIHEENVPMTLTLYFSGKFTLVGAQSERQVFLAFSWLSRVLWAFAVQSSLAPSAPKDNFDAWLAWAENEERRCTPMPPWEDEERNVVYHLNKREAKRVKANTVADTKMIPAQSASAVVKQENAPASSAAPVAVVPAAVEPVVPQSNGQVPPESNGQAPMAVDQPAAAPAAAAEEAGEDVEWE